MTYKKIESEFWTPEKEGDTLEGEVIGMQKDNFEKLQATVKTAKGVRVTPSHAVLQNKMSSFKDGDKVKIVFTGEQESKVQGRSPTKLYDVFIDE